MNQLSWCQLTRPGSLSQKLSECPLLSPSHFTPTVIKHESLKSTLRINEPDSSTPKRCWNLILTWTGPLILTVGTFRPFPVSRQFTSAFSNPVKNVPQRTAWQQQSYICILGVGISFDWFFTKGYFFPIPFLNTKRTSKYTSRSSLSFSENRIVFLLIKSHLLNDVNFIYFDLIPTWWASD